MGGIEVKGKGNMQTFMWVPPPDFQVSPINPVILASSNSCRLLSAVMASMGPAKAVSLCSGSGQTLSRISQGIVRRAGSQVNLSGMYRVGSKSNLSNLTEHPE